MASTDPFKQLNIKFSYEQIKWLEYISFQFRQACKQKNQNNLLLNSNFQDFFSCLEEYIHYAKNLISEVGNDSSYDTEEIGMIETHLTQMYEFAGKMLDFGLEPNWQNMHKVSSNIQRMQNDMADVKATFTKSSSDYTFAGLCTIASFVLAAATIACVVTSNYLLAALCGLASSYFISKANDLLTRLPATVQDNAAKLDEVNNKLVDYAENAMTFFQAQNNNASPANDVKQDNETSANDVEQNQASNTAGLKQSA